jgi:aminomethyltransferase
MGDRIRSRVAGNPEMREVRRNTEAPIKTTILHDAHVALGAKMAPFGGYDMPIQYNGIIKEHVATREAAAIFDTCHMGEFSIKGPTALRDLETLLSCPVGDLKIGGCRYGLLCNENGGVNDDQIIYRMAEDDFFMVVNASTEPADFEWVSQHLSKETRIENLSATTAKLDLQGPKSAEIMQKLMALPIDGMKYYTWAFNRYKGREVLISRTGYTGELGFEIYCSNDLGLAFWQECLDLGAIPAGLGARDTLRLEMGFPLYGHELDRDMNAAESGFFRAIGGNKKFIGSDIVLDASKSNKRLIGIRLEGRRSARNGDGIADTKGRLAGKVTSGSFSPSLACAIALGYVENELSEPGTPLVIKTERIELAGVVTDLPFYKKATGRRNIKDFV